VLQQLQDRFGRRAVSRRAAAAYSGFTASKEPR
jgi:hypothetical protein